ncbi:hypothetical protein CIB84_005141 [Bambusicola thoracicus]|uniref:Uncharacterized protein n=1 Tax=Bambusicola thoracicus TaxID=9083 RepID=A0A2P4T442_BAMTH|nr:hypothetical protein CIB84_005141 [Bambusicola thoracicus]
MKSVDCVHVIQQKDTASSPSGPPGAASGTTGLFSVTFLWLAMLLSSCLAAVSLYHAITLKTELEALRSELIYRVRARSPLEQPPVSPGDKKAGAPVSSFLQVSAAGARQRKAETETPPVILVTITDCLASMLFSEVFKFFSPGSRYRSRYTRQFRIQMLQACLQLIADSKSDIQQKDDSSIVPWLLSFKRGTALEEQGNKIVIKETGYFFIYGQASVLQILSLILMGINHSGRFRISPGIDEFPFWAEFRKGTHLLDHCVLGKSRNELPPNK